MSDNPLGEKVKSPTLYDPDILFAISRNDGRDALGLGAGELPFNGCDYWNAFEVSCLNTDGIPLVCCLMLEISCRSRSIVESKSLKLYLNSLNNKKFTGLEELSECIRQDLAGVIEGDFSLCIKTLADLEEEGLRSFEGKLLDGLNLEDQINYPDKSALSVGKQEVKDESVVTHLFRSLCPVTAQPDWASIQITYSGNRIQEESILNYLLSYRNHSGFHEHCIEKIFVDIHSACQPNKLSVYGRFNRRGGIDINPYRSTEVLLPGNKRVSRQ